MLEGCKNARERWSGVHVMIDKWLQERQELLVLYSRLAQQLKTDSVADVAVLHSLCEVMVDYTSAGHFEIFEQLCREAEAFSDQKAIDLSNRIFPQIQISTDVILDFNEIYGERTISDEDLAKLSEQLSHLGEHLADRFQQEDILIETLHTAHQESVSP